MSASQPRALSLGLSVLILYLAANAVTGRAGLLSYLDLQERERNLTAEAANLAAERTELRARVRALAGDSPDRDALEEAARRQLGAASADEIVFDLAQNGSAQTP